MRQCNGITLKGERCKKTAITIGLFDKFFYCQFHYFRIKPEDSGVKIFECGCCFGEYFENDKVVCTFGHKFCKKCISDYTGNTLASGSYELHCVDVNGCEGKFTHPILEKALNNLLYNVYVEKEITEIIRKANLENLYTCPKCTIYSAILDKEYREINGAKLICGNPNCNHISCIDCKEIYHTGGCEYVKRDKTVRKEVEEILTRNRTRNCVCGYKMVRIDGCNKIICPCGARICYNCEKKISGYEHYYGSRKCPLYTDESAIEKLSFEKSLDEIYDKYMKNKTILMQEVYPILCELEKHHVVRIKDKFTKRKCILL